MQRDEKTSTDINSDLLILLASFTVTELMRTLQSKGLLTPEETNDALTRAVKQFDRANVVTTPAETNALVEFLLGTHFSGLPASNDKLQ